MTRLTTLFLVVSLFLLSGFSASNSETAIPDESFGEKPLKIAGESTCTSSDPVISCRNWVNSMGHPGNETCVILGVDNILRIRSYVRTGSDNLNAHPPIMLEYDWGGYLTGVTDPIEVSDLQAVTINGVEVYEAIFQFEIMLNDACVTNPPNVPFPFSYVNKLVTYDPTEETYPLYDVKGIPELFPPTIFEEVLDLNYVPVFTGDKNLCCSDQANTSMVDDDSTAKRPMAQTQQAESSGNSKTDVFKGPLVSGKIPGDVPVFQESAQIYPNPFSGNFDIRFDLPEAALVTFEIIGVNGIVYQTFKNEFSKEQNKINVDGQNLVPGVYYCKIHYKNQTQILKVVKMR